jgi:type II secretory ATPase GspE/PulE/Tfp pilus assembly ATPase PilB-like protein
MSATDDNQAHPLAARSGPEALEALVQRGEAAGASDIHLQMMGPHADVAFRLDGVLVPACTLPASVARQVFGRVKYLSKLKTYQESLPQDGRIDRADVGAREDIRVATYPTVTGEKMVLRLFSAFAVLELDGLGFPLEARRALEGFLARPSGLLLLTGPAGSGKTTTIYACLQYLATHGGRHIITIEDPVERALPGIMQTEVSEARGLTFAAAVRHLLRQDPEVLVIGEIRDEETADMAVRAAFTGHLVIATLHAGSSRGVFERLFDMCGDRHAAIAAVEMVVNQRLVRRRCAACGGDRCDACLATGYRGRVPLVEWVRVDDTARAGLREQGPRSIEPETSLRAAARVLVEDGTTDPREIERVLGS